MIYYIYQYIHIEKCKCYIRLFCCSLWD